MHCNIRILHIMQKIHMEAYTQTAHTSTKHFTHSNQLLQIMDTYSVCVFPVLVYMCGYLQGEVSDILLTLYK